MKKHLILIAVSALVLAVSCGKESAEPAVSPGSITKDGVEVTFHAFSDPGTKTQLNGKQVLWSAKDAISVLYGSENRKFVASNTEPSASVDFSGVLSEAYAAAGAGSKVFAVYPYSRNNELTGEYVKLSVPWIQRPVPDSFDPNAFPSVAVTTTDSFLFYNVAGGIKVRFTRDNIGYMGIVSNGGEGISGSVVVGFGSDGIPYIKELDVYDDYIEVYPGGGDDCFRTDCDYYIAVLPGTLGSGLTFSYEINYTDALKEYPQPVTFERNVFKSATGIDKNVKYDTYISWYPGEEDLGLSVLWGKANLGSDEPSGTGWYYAWAEIEPKDEFWLDNYLWGGGDSSEPSRYNSSDGLLTIIPEDDPATVKLNAKWRTPTVDEFIELVEKCEWTYTEQDGQQGWNIQSKVAGYTDKSIFLPAAGYMDGNSRILDRASYWTSSIDDEECQWAWCYDDSQIAVDSRYYGRQIRPVKEKITLKDFAKGFVKGLEVWESTVGTVETDAGHVMADGTAWENAHYIPVYKSGGPYDNNSGNQFDYRLHYRWTFNIDGKLYSADDAWEIAARGLLDMCTSEGQEFYSTMSGPNATFHAANGKSLNKIPIPAAQADGWGMYPWYESSPDGFVGLRAADGSVVKECNVDFMLRTCAWALNRTFIGGGTISDYVLYDGANASYPMYNGYRGAVSSMRQLLVLMRIYKYLLDNDINDNVYTAIRNVKFDMDLYGPGAMSIDGDFSDWDWLPSSKVSSAEDSGGSSFSALKVLKAYANSSNIYLYVSWDTSRVSVSDTPSIPVDIFINGDNNSATGFYPNGYSTSGADVLYEGSFTEGTDCVRFAPDVYLWDGGSNHESFSWKEMYLEIDNPGMGLGEDGACEIKFYRAKYPGTLADDFSLGMTIMKDWNVIGELPNSGASGYSFMPVHTDK